QAPPAYSAAKVGGRRLYEAARAGEALEAAPRPIVVHAFAVTGMRDADVDFTTTVSSGTYVRSLAADLGRDLGCGAHLSRLVRTAIGPFRLEDASPPDAPALRPALEAVGHLPRIVLGADEARAASHGSILAPAGFDGPYAVLGPDGALIGVWRDDVAKARPEVVLPTA
ncbi:MAG: tRNA pseudouridine(55) synthase TruB, partial [Actinomycetota bacterium]